MSVEFDLPQPELEWLASPVHEVHQPDSTLLGWLRYRDVLTIRMKESSQAAFGLQLLEQCSGPGLMVNELNIRRVILWSGTVPCIYAESHIPNSALIALPALRQLGGDPLGEFLHKNSDVRRGEFEYALLQSPELPTPLEALSGRPMWARRARYSAGGSGLIVAEMFLPGITSLKG
ncbi:MAG TPA: chorismate lyase [Xanthomonadales bacterium]|nr:chorismate lyase [Xanthomonadales bacterium]